MSKNRNIVVFWIDEAPRKDFLERMQTAGMQVFHADNYVEGVEWLSNPKNRDMCDAVILDVNCKIRHTDTRESTDSFRDYAYRVMSRCEEGKTHILWFVFTTGSGYDASLLSAIPMRAWTRKQYYLKDTDQQSLVNDIRELTKHSDNIALRERYAGIFDLCTDEVLTIRLQEIIRKVEDEQNFSDTTVFNAMRKLLAFAVSYARDHGLFDDNIATIRDAHKRLMDIHRIDPQIVPSYVTTNFGSLTDTVNNGSHSKYETTDDNKIAVDSDVLSGKAPYLTRVAFYQLLTVLHWLQQLPTEPDKIAALQKQMDTLTDPIRYYEGRECHLQCDNGIWHLGQCAIRVHERYPVTEQTIVRLKNVQLNKNYKTRRQYPFYGTYEIVYYKKNIL